MIYMIVNIWKFYNLYDMTIWTFCDLYDGEYMDVL